MQMRCSETSGNSPGPVFLQQGKKMAIDESNYKTMKLLRCKKCGNVYAAGLSGSTECPECASDDASQFRPDGQENSGNQMRGINP
jgi:hypothetical protein